MDRTVEFSAQWKFLRCFVCCLIKQSYFDNQEQVERSTLATPLCAFLAFLCVHLGTRSRAFLSLTTYLDATLKKRAKSQFVALTFEARH